MFERIKKVLVLAPHTDDGEFGCGATIARFIKEGADVYYAAFSACESSVLSGFPKDILISEVKAATSVLGVKPENLILFKYDVRTFNFHRQSILDDMIKLKKELIGLWFRMFSRIDLGDGLEQERTLGKR